MSAGVYQFQPIRREFEESAIALVEQTRGHGHFADAAKERRIAAVHDKRGYVIHRRGQVHALATLPNLDTVCGPRLQIDPAIVDPVIERRGVECMMQPIVMIWPVLYREPIHEWTALEINLRDRPQMEPIYREFNFVEDDHDPLKLYLPLSDIKACADQLVRMIGTQIGHTKGRKGDLKIILQRPGPMFWNCNRAAFAHLASKGGPLPENLQVERSVFHLPIQDRRVICPF